jgi:hypothetical protein
LSNKAASGDSKATQTLFAQLRDTESLAAPGSADTTIGEADQQIIQRIKARFRGEKA